MDAALGVGRRGGASPCLLDPRIWFPLTFSFGVTSDLINETTGYREEDLVAGTIYTCGTIHVSAGIFGRVHKKKGEWLKCECDDRHFEDVSLIV